MTSPTFANKISRPRRSAFTLVEMLAVIGIILLLIGILLPALIRALALAERARISSELSSISAALEMYRGDYSDYPRITTFFGNGDSVNTGAAVLGKALFALGPAADPASAFDNTVSYGIYERVSSGGTVYECTTANPINPTYSVAPPNATYWKTVTDYAPAYSATTSYSPGMMVSDAPPPSTTTTYVCVTAGTGAALSDLGHWTPFNWSDGAGISQYRARAHGAVKEAYLRADRFKVSGTDILDKNGFPILYFPAAPGSHNPAINRGYIANPSAAYSVRKSGSQFDAMDNISSFRSLTANETNDTNSILRFSAMLGDVNANGVIDTGETAIAAGQPFLLWSAGVDGIYGPDFSGAQPTNTRNVDDVTNFR